MFLYCTISKILSIISQNLKKSHDHDHAHMMDCLSIQRLILHVANQCTKFEVSYVHQLRISDVQTPTADSDWYSAYRCHVSVSCCCRLWSRHLFGCRCLHGCTWHALQHSFRYVVWGLHCCVMLWWHRHTHWSSANLTTATLYWFECRQHFSDNCNQSLVLLLGWCSQPGLQHTQHHFSMNFIG